MTAPEPVFTWNPDHPAFHTPEAYAWVSQHVDLPTMIYRVEFYDGPYMIVYRYKTNAEGRRYREGEGVAAEAPFRVELDDLPPEHPHLAGKP